MKAPGKNTTHGSGVAGVWPFSERARSNSMFNLKKSQVGKRDSSPLVWLQFIHAGVRERSGDKSLFPTCEFLMFGDLLHLGASQEWGQNGQTPATHCRGWDSRRHSVVRSFFNRTLAP